MASGNVNRSVDLHPHTSLGLRKCSQTCTQTHVAAFVSYTMALRDACIYYIVNVLRMSDCRLVKLVMLEALEMRGRIEWVRDLQRSLNDFGWGNVNVEDLGRLSAGEIGQMLHDSAVRSVKSSWEAEAQDRSKLDVLQRLWLMDVRRDV